MNIVTLILVLVTTVGLVITLSTKSMRDLKRYKEKLVMATMIREDEDTFDKMVQITTYYTDSLEKFYDEVEKIPYPVRLISMGILEIKYAKALRAELAEKFGGAVT